MSVNCLDSIRLQFYLYLQQSLCPSSSKIQVWMSNIPGWKEHESDQFDRAICLTQMKLGLLALNCVSNGISTLLCNFIMRDSVPTAAVRVSE